MQLLDDRLLLSATDLINHLECAHLSHLDLEVVNGRASIEETREEAAELVARKGDEHEATYLESLRAAGREVARQRASRASPAWSVAPSAPASDARRGRDHLPGRLFDGERWRGYADFLERVPKPSALGEWSYRLESSRLARRPRRARRPATTG